MELLLSDVGSAARNGKVVEVQTQAGIPMLFVHQQDSPYLSFTLAQAQHANPQSPIHLIGDEHNQHYTQVFHHLIDRLKDPDAQAFIKAYRHHSTNHYDYELFCFLRWFLIRALMREWDYRSVFVADSDVMVYAELSRHARRIGLGNTCMAAFNIGVDHRWVQSASGHSSYWTWEGINLFCQFLLELYTTPEGTARLEGVLQQKQEIRDAVGVSDMTALYLFYERYSSQITNLSRCLDGSTFDHNIGMGTNYDIEEFETQRGRKRIWMLEGHPVCYNRQQDCLINMLSLHFQGGYKNVVHRYYTGKGLWHRRVWREMRFQASRFYRFLRG